MFPRLSRIKESVYARIRFVIFMTLRGIKFVKKAYREIEMNRKIAKNLGFNPNKIPSYETIRHFIFDLLPNKIEEIFYRIVSEIEKQLKKKGKWTGKAVEDATVIIARKRDEEAKYNGYYETHVWKKDLFIDSSNKIFLSYKDMEINENEGEHMEYHLRKLNELGIRITHITADGKYATYYNIAMSNCQYDVDFLYKPQKGWVYNKKRRREENKRKT